MEGFSPFVITPIDILSFNSPEFSFKRTLIIVGFCLLLNKGLIPLYHYVILLTTYSGDGIAKKVISNAAFYRLLVNNTILFNIRKNLFLINIYTVISFIRKTVLYSKVFYLVNRLICNLHTVQKVNKYNPLLGELLQHYSILFVDVCGYKFTVPYAGFLLIDLFLEVEELSFHDKQGIIVSR
jgi:hypothetical protein